jgi:putative oxidoreductase
MKPDNPEQPAVVYHRCERNDLRAQFAAAAAGGTIMDSTDLGMLILRVVVGATMFAHGAQKAWGWWQGPGYDNWSRAVDGMGFRPVGVFTNLSIAAELAGGFLLLGILTPLFATLIVGHAIVIIGKAHLAKGFWNKDSGYEFPLSLLAGAAAILLIGPGLVSIDALIGFSLASEWRLALFAVAILGGLATLALPRLIAAEPRTTLKSS